MRHGHVGRYKGDAEFLVIEYKTGIWEVNITVVGVAEASDDRSAVV